MDKNRPVRIRLTMVVVLVAVIAAASFFTAPFLLDKLKSQEPESQPVINQETTGETPIGETSVGDTPAEETPAAEIPQPEPEKTAAGKYYEYFAQHNYRINPLFSFSADKGTDDQLMVFAIMNIPGNNYEKGNTKEEIDAVLNKYFGRTVKNYVTGMTEYVPGTDRIRSIGWDVNGSNRLVLTRLLTNSDGSFTGYFDVYHIPELYAEDNNLKEFWSEIDGLLLSGNPGKYSELLSSKAVITFNELPEGDGGFYLKYNQIQAVNIDNPMSQLYTEDELDARKFETNERFAAQEATFAGISVQTTKEELVEKLGEPLEVIEETDPIPTETYIYGGVEYIFEAGGNTVDCINVTRFQWRYGPRNIRIGESFEDVLARFPQEQDYKTHPNGNFYGETTYLEEGGAVYFNADGNIENITVVPEGVLPFMKIHFEEGRVSGYTIYGSTT